MNINKLQPYHHFECKSRVRFTNNWRDLVKQINYSETSYLELMASSNERN